MRTWLARTRRIVIGTLPPQLRTDDPIIRYLLGAERQQTWRNTAGQFIVALLLIIAAWFVVGTISLNDDTSLSQRALALLILPTVVVQSVLSVGLFVIAAGAIVSEKRRGTWTDLRATPEGVGLVLRAHWATTVFYRLRGLMLFVYTLRFVMIGLLLYDLTSFRGEYLYHITARVVPDVSVEIGGLLLVLTVTAGLVLPLATWGFDAASGLLVATLVRQRVFLGVARVVVGTMRLMISLAALVSGVTVLSGLNGDPEAGSWFLALAYGAIGDIGFAYLNGPTLSGLWQNVEYTILIGGVMLIIALVLALLTDLMLRWAMQRAQRIE